MKSGLLPLLLMIPNILLLQTYFLLGSPNRRSATLLASTSRSTFAMETRPRSSLTWYLLPRPLRAMLDLLEAMPLRFQ